MTTPPRTLLGLALLAPTALAQIVVDPTGAGQFVDLQAAIDAAAPGAVIRVVGGSYGSVRIDKSLTIIGDPAPLIASAPQGSGVQPPAIDLVGTGSEELTLAHVVVRGTATFPYNGPGAGIRSRGFAAIRIYHAEIRAHEYVLATATGLFRGAPGLDVGATDVAQVTIADSRIQGSASGTDGTPIFGEPGPAAIDAPSATVLAVDSVLIGGAGSDTVLPTPFGTTPCPCPGSFGTGGDGIVAAETITMDIVVQGGRGGLVFYGGPGGVQPWGQQPNGQAMQAGSSKTAGFFSVSAPDPLRQGQPWPLYFAPRGGATAALLVGRLGTPRTVRPFRGLYFLAPSPLAAVPIDPARGAVTLTVPTATGLAGLEFAFQVALIDTPLGEDLSEVVPRIVDFP
ncbi:MAG: hypothetical protein AAF628_32925 [Planctomycetota bacterium]